MDNSITQRNTDPLAKQVADQIAQMIAQQELSAGQRLPNEFELAQMLHVGRGTIREAIKQLVARNLVRVERGRGTFVVENPGLMHDPLGLTFVHDRAELGQDLLEVRLQIEPWCAAQAARYATDEQIEQMWAQCRWLEAWSKAETHSEEERQERIDVDFKLHTLIAEATGNLVMPRLLPVIYSGVELLTQLSDRRPGANRISNDTHRQMVQAIADHQPESARQAMLEHLLPNQHSVDMYLEEQAVKKE